jgi:hypothetical protein
MQQPISSGDSPAFDFIGWAFTNIVNFNSLDITGFAILCIFIVSFCLILVFFSALRSIGDEHKRLVIVSFILALVMLSNGVFLLNYVGIRNLIDIPVIFIAVLIANNFVLWMGAIVLPTCFLYPRIQKQNLWKIVGICFFVTGFLRYGSISLIIHNAVPDFSSIIYSEAVIFAGYNLLMIPVTIGFAITSYWLIHEIMQRVPFVRRILGAE